MAGRFALGVSESQGAHQRVPRTPNLRFCSRSIMAELRVYTMVSRHRNTTAFLGCLETVGGRLRSLSFVMKVLHPCKRIRRQNSATVEPRDRSSHQFTPPASKSSELLLVFDRWKLLATGTVVYTHGIPRQVDTRCTRRVYQFL
jgi:hypothetical protein